MIKSKPAAIRNVSDKEMARIMDNTDDDRICLSYGSITPYTPDGKYYSYTFTDEHPVHTNEPIIKVKYFTDVEPLEKISKGDWIDLRSAVDIELKAGDTTVIPLGIGMKLPEGYEAWLAPRSSTCKNFGIIQTNSIGIIDNSYSGDDDQWMMAVMAIRDTTIHKNDRICQFRIVKSMGTIGIKTVTHLDTTNRGGYGSTGVN